MGDSLKQSCPQPARSVRRVPRFRPKLRHLQSKSSPKDSDVTDKPKVVIITPEYRQAQEALSSALEAELAAAKRFSADRSPTNWQACLEAHSASMAAVDICRELEPAI